MPLDGAELAKFTRRKSNSAIPPYSLVPFMDELYSEYAVSDVFVASDIYFKATLFFLS